MQDRTQLSLNGQELQTADVNAISKAASLADDRVLAELLRLAPFNGTTYAKAVLPYATSLGAGAVVAPGTGAVTINPFRAVVGSRTAVATSALDNWQDVRSAVFVGGAAALSLSQSITANASGNPRWDLIYVVLSPDANGPNVTRYVKTPATKVVTATAVVGTLTTTAAIGVMAGTPSTTPAFPTLTSDSGGTIYIPLAYVRVINGFTGATVLTNRDIFEVAPVVPLSRVSGASTLRPADQQNSPTGTAISGTGTTAATSLSPNGPFSWRGTSGQRPGCFIPPSMAGSESLLIAIDLTGTTSANWSHQNNAIVDQSRDWRNRLFKWTASVGLSLQGGVPWNGDFSVQSLVLFAVSNAAPGYGPDAFIPGVGHSFQGGLSVNQTVLNLAASGAAGTAAPAAGFNVSTNSMVTGTAVALYVDPTTGALKVSITGVPQCGVLIWLDATAPFANA